MYLSVVFITCYVIFTKPGCGRRARLAGQVAYTLTGRDYTFIPASRTKDPSDEAGFLDKLHLTGQISLGRTDVGDFRWFLKADYGYDYYNIRFFQKLQHIQLGIVGDPASLIR